MSAIAAMWSQSIPWRTPNQNPLTSRPKLKPPSSDTARLKHPVAISCKRTPLQVAEGQAGEIPASAHPRSMLDPMAHCAECGAPTDLSDRFCGRCGTALAGVAPVQIGLTRFCGGCGGSLEADARFCRRCGARAPEPREDVFAGMPAATNGHERSAADLAEELFVP